jgi:predicted GNAT superfamily acetyltransferase
MPTPGDLTFRPLSSLPDYEACMELQRVTWGQDFSDVVPLSILKIVQKVGGVAAGAFGPDGRMLGFIFGVTGFRDDRPLHWSHMLAIDPEARDLGLGTRLKLYQRELILASGVDEMQWTYDPLESRNAHLNFNHLGVEVAEYVEDMYEGELWSDLARGIGTDRFIVSWKVRSERALRVICGERPDVDRFREAPVVNPGGATGELPPGGLARVEIPENVQALKGERPDAASAWRLSTRRAFESALARGWRVEAFYRDPASGRSFYGLEKS